MFEAMYSGEEEIEAKYLYNFSPNEKRRFIRHIQREQKIMAEYQRKLDKLIAEDPPNIFANCLTSSNGELDIKYILNRIAANDPRDTCFELSAVDGLKRPDWWALRIADAFRNNTVCSTVVLQNLDLTTNGIEPLLRTFRHKKLGLLDISGNKIGESLPTLMQILEDPNTQWEKVRLGKIPLNSEQKKSLEQHENVSFVALPPKQKVSYVVRNWFQRQQGKNR